jgi:hypothetical protein
MPRAPPAAPPDARRAAASGVRGERPGDAAPGSGPRPPGICERTLIGPTPPATEGAPPGLGRDCRRCRSPRGAPRARSRRVERGAHVRRRRRRSHDPTVAHPVQLAFADRPSRSALTHRRLVPLYRSAVRRRCETWVHATATATFTFDARELTVWLDTPADGRARPANCANGVRVLTPQAGISMTAAAAASSKPRSKCCHRGHPLLANVPQRRHGLTSQGS